MSRKRGVLLIFLVAASLTTFVNYFALRVIVPAESFNASTEDETNKELKSKVNFLLNYRVNKSSSLGWTTSNEVIGVAAAAADDEMILRHPLNLPKSLINCTNANTNAAEFTSGSAEDTATETGSRKSRRFKRASFTITTNFIVANRQVNCGEFITYTTHGDFRYLDNLVPLVERWVGPVSITLYAPGMDLQPTLQRIFYLRECTTPLIKEWVTFHLFSDTRNFIDPAPFLSAIERSNSNSEICNEIPDFDEGLPTIRTKRKLLYPVNVARNVARQEATTHYILASDIELYPSLNLIPDFFELIARNESYFQSHKNPYVFVLPIFEIENGSEIPESKDRLVELLYGGTAVPFHKYICPECHTVPKYNEWINDTGTEDELNIFHVAKRKKPFHFWEPIYIGTNTDPFYDERLSWEGLRDKMSQGYALCVLDYDFLILDNAFLIHRPGIKKKKHNMVRPNKAIRKQNRIIARKVEKELTKLYGKRHGCIL